ncbi:hypothetical protein AMTRI_Chr13g117500 [Amborella trichopoda]
MGIFIKAVATMELDYLIQSEGGEKNNLPLIFYGNCEPNQFIDDSAKLDESEKRRRMKISKANKGNVSMNKGRKRRPDFIDMGKELQDEDEWRVHRRPFLPREEEQDVEDLERLIKQKYGRSDHLKHEEETTQVVQQALLPSVKDLKLWTVKCANGHEREVAFCLMEKCMDVQSQGIKQQIKSVITLDYLTNYIYIEADKEAHVKEACKGMRHIYSNTKPMLVPIKEMTDVLSVKSKSVELSKDTWVRLKLGTYKGDLAKVLDVDNVRQRVTIKLIPRIDLKALANKLEGNEVGKKKKNFVPPPRFINNREMKYMHIPVERKQDAITGEYFETIDGMMFKDGYLYKTVSMKSISSQNIQPSFDELEKFRKPGKDSDGDMAGLSTVFANRKKGHFMKGDAVIVVRGDIKNLMGWVEKETLAVNEKELCKYFKPGDHVKVVSGAQEGATGMVVKVEGHVLIISSDTTKEGIRVFADIVVESSEITFGITKLGDYVLHRLMQME